LGPSIYLGKEGSKARFWGKEGQGNFLLRALKIFPKFLLIWVGFGRLEVPKGGEEIGEFKGLEGLR